MRAKFRILGKVFCFSVLIFSLTVFAGAEQETKKEKDKDKGEAPAGQEQKEAKAAKEEAELEEYVRLHDWDKVVSTCEDALRKNPDDSVVFRRLIDGYMVQKNYDAVIKNLAPLAQGDVTNDAYSNILANAYAGAGKATEAIDLYKKKIEKDPDSPGLLGRYAQALTNFGMLDEAVQQWQKAFAIDPRNLLFKQRVGEIYLQQGKFQEAKKEFEELNNLAPGSQQWYKDTAVSKLQVIEENLKTK